MLVPNVIELRDTRTGNQFDGGAYGRSNQGVRSCYSQLSAPPLRYSVTRLSKKFFSFLRSIVSLIQGKGFRSR